MAQQPFWMPDAWAGRTTAAPRSEWDQVELGGIILPGEARIVDPGEIAVKIDKQNAKGTKGSDFVQTGFDFAKFGILVTLFTPDEWDEWQRFVPTILPKTAAKGNIQPQSIYYPSLAAHGINQCIILAVGIPREGKTPQTVDVPIRCEQWEKVKKVAVSRPTIAASTAKSKRTIVTDREEQWRNHYQNIKGTTLPADQIPPMPPSFAETGPDG